VIDTIFLAIALSMDAFAVSIGLGSKQSEKTFTLALKSGVYFGVFQALMPLIGYSGGKGILTWIEWLAPWLAFILLILIGGKMIYESFGEGVEDNLSQVNHRVMLTLALATSIDAMAAGFSITLLSVSLLFACILIGTMTFGFSWIGVYIGKISGAWLESKAEMAGGFILIFVAFKILVIQN